MNDKERSIVMTETIQDIAGGISNAERVREYIETELTDHRLQVFPDTQKARKKRGINYNDYEFAGWYFS